MSNTRCRSAALAHRSAIPELRIVSAPYGDAETIVAVPAFGEYATLLGKMARSGVGHGQRVLADEIPKDEDERQRFFEQRANRYASTVNVDVASDDPLIIPFVFIRQPSGEPIGGGEVRFDKDKNAAEITVYLNDKHAGGSEREGLRCARMLCDFAYEAGAEVIKAGVFDSNGISLEMFKKKLGFRGSPDVEYRIRGLEEVSIPYQALGVTDSEWLGMAFKRPASDEPHCA